MGPFKEYIRKSEPNKREKAVMADNNWAAGSRWAENVKISDRYCDSEYPKVIFSIDENKFAFK